MEKQKCLKCNGTGIVMNYDNKGVHTCWDCLQKHYLDQDTQLNKKEVKQQHD